MASWADAQRARVLEFWQTVEMFSPPKVEKVDYEKLVYDVRPGRPLPWEAGHQLARRTIRPDQTWRHVVYVGIYRLDAVFDVLSRVLKPDADSYDERPGGESAVAAFVVDEDGHAVLDSQVLSSCAWATGRVLNNELGIDWLSRFQNACIAFGEVLHEVVTFRPAGQPDDDSESAPRVLSIEHLGRCLAVAVTAAGTDAALSSTEIRISSHKVARRTAENESGPDFLNSFIMDDLALVAEQTAKGNIGTALREYLRPDAEIPVAGRVDVCVRTDRVFAATAPETVPAGRWPSDPEHALALSQQLAVNTALALGDTGIIGVNGPPGTGKTTMLRDLVAALVVERAQRLAEFAAPKQAFTGKKLRWKTGQYNRVVNVLRPELTGFEVVVASSNNGAVQNVTDEIPAADAIAESWRDRATEVDYFPAIAGGLLAPDAETPTPPTGTASPSSAAWALVAAKLGNKANRGRFVTAFWYHTPDEQDEDGWSGMMSVLKTYEQTAPERPWAEAVADFRAAVAQVEAVRADRSEACRAIDERARIERELARLDAALPAAAEQVEAARTRRDAAVQVERERTQEAERIANDRRLAAERDARRRRDDAEQAVSRRRADAERTVNGPWADAERAVQSWEAERGRRWQAHAAHQQSRPGWWDWLRTLGAANGRWSRTDTWLGTQVGDAQRALDQAHAGLRTARQEVDAARRAVDEAENELAAVTHLLAVGIPTPNVPYEPLLAARRELAHADREVTAAAQAKAAAESAQRTAHSRLTDLDTRLAGFAAALGKHYPDDTWWADRERREPAALWTDPRWNKARSELFLAALALHKAFMSHAATELRQNLRAAMDLVGGEAPSDVSEDAALGAWQSLFFVVPVVSTTFASYARLFSHLGREALGWLLIDEAGQATPQNAVGALWRARRAVVVGDPLQLEPITALPFRAEQAIRTEFGVDEEWTTRSNSVQHLADRLTPLGTHLPTDGDAVWVGVPLIVHRRCDQPMFGIVNAVAYHGLMIDGTGTAGGERFKARYPTLPDSKWIDVVGTADGNWIPDEGRQLDKILEVLADLGHDMSEVMAIGPFRDIARRIEMRKPHFPGLEGGTVHTAQGKQADVVIFVLGGDPDRAGVRRWAASRPNLLNVAVSRAKRRLYVIGDRRSWSTQRYFKTLAAKLPHSRAVNDGHQAPPRQR